VPHPCTNQRPLTHLPWLLACILLWVPAAAQESASTLPSLDPARALTQYAKDVWRRSEGLPQNGVAAITQTPDGYLWVGTEEGFARFDGLTFRVFDRRAVPAMSTNNVSALLADPDGTLWIGTRGGGLLRLQQTQFTSFGDDKGLVNDAVTALHRGPDGALWVGTAGGLQRLEDDRLVTARLAGPSGTIAVTALAHDAAGALWVGTNSGVARLDKTGTTWITGQEGLRSDEVRALIVTGDGSVWVGGLNGLQRFRGGRFDTWTTMQGLGANLVVSLLEDRAGTIWIGTRGGGLSRLVGDQLSTFSTAEGLSHEDVVALFEDREGSLWIGTNNGGLNRFRHATLTTIGRPEGLSHDIVLPIVADASGAVWAGTYGGGLNRLEGSRITTFRQADGLSSDVVLSLWPGRDGSMLVGTRSGIDRITNGRISSLSREIELSPTTVNALYEDRRGTLWIGTRQGLLRVADGSVTREAAATGWPTEFVSAIVEDGDGAIWVATQGGGVRRYKDGRWTSLSEDDGLPSPVVWSVNLDSEGTVWAGTTAGVVRWRGNRFSAYTVAHRLPSDSIFQVLDDGFGALWMSSNSGIFRVSRESLDAVDAGAPSLDVRWFDESDGMKSRECNGGFQPAGWRHGNRLLFPTTRGFVTVDPARIWRNTHPPPVTIERAMANGTEFTPWLAADVPPGPGDLEFRYTSTSLLAPAKLRFRYRLEGFDDTWVDAGERRTAFYTNIPPGEYSFRVTARNEDGIWNETGAAVHLRLQPKFHQRPVVYILLGALALAAAGGAHQVRVRSLRARDRALAAGAEERVKALEKLRSATEILELVAQQTDDAVIVVDEHGRMRVYNPAAEREHGVQLTSVAPEEWPAIYGLHDMDGRPLRIQDVPLYRALHGETVPQAEWQVRRPDGEMRTLVGSATPLRRPDGSPAGAVLIAHDATERRRHELERERLLASEQRARATAETADRMKDDFLATLSHELRTPLNAVMGWTRILKSQPHDETTARGLEIIERNAAAQARLVEEILDASSIVRGTFRLQVEAVDLPALIRGAVDSVGPTASAKGLRVEVILEPDLPALEGDPQRLQQVLWNLLMNAVKFTPAGWITVRAARSPGGVAIDVSDSGIGMGPDVLPHVFERFRQGDSSATRPYPGLGLGLALVRHLVELHGGQVEAWSAGEGQGATFRVTLPAAVATREG
jgi:PAS domain S-box-containing protein